MRSRPPMTREDVDDYRVPLVALAGYLSRTLARDRRELMHEDEPEVPGGPMPATEHVPDGGRQEVATGLIAHESHLLREVEAALRRIEDGSFGRCEECGKVISRCRLDALPYARQCIRCARVAQPVLA